MNVHLFAERHGLQCVPNPTDPAICTEDFEAVSVKYPFPKTPYPFPRLYRGLPGTVMQEALQRMGCRVSGRSLASAIGVTVPTDSEERYRHTRAVELMPCKCLAS